MKLLDALIVLSVSAFLASIVLQFVGYVIFRRHAHQYEALICEFRMQNLHLDTLTRASVFLTASFHPLKISWFARLYKGVKLYKSRNQRVSQETYNFIQSLPEDEIAWLVRLHKLNMVAGSLMIGGGVGFIIWRHLLS